MTEDFIQLKKDNIIRIKIKDQFGNDTGKELEFDLEDIELPIRYQQMLEEHKKNILNVRNQLIIIEKRQDFKGKKLLTKNEEDKIKAIKDFYVKEMDAMDLFLGRGKTQMILDIMKRKPYMSMFDDIGEALVPIIPIFEKNMELTEKQIKNKYQIKDESVIE